jgi:amino acid transporter
VPIVFLERYRSAFVIFSIAIFSLLLFLALLASWLGVWCLVVVGLILVVFSLILTFASIRIGVRVRAQILKSPPSGRRQRLIRATNLIILSSIVFLLFIIAGFFNLLPVNAIWVNGTLLSHHPTTHSRRLTNFFSSLRYRTVLHVVLAGSQQFSSDCSIYTKEGYRHFIYTQH